MSLVNDDDRISWPDVIVVLGGLTLAVGVFIALIIHLTPWP